MRFTASDSACIVGEVQLRSPTDGWGVCTDPTPGGQSLLRYDGHVWSTQAAPSALHLGANTSLWLSGIATLSATDGWAVGYTTGTGADPNQRVVGIILRYVGGQWTLFQTINDVELRSVATRSATDGWAIGERVVYQGDASTNRYAQVGSAPLILRYQQGQWSPVSLSLATADPARYLTVVLLLQVVMRSPTDGWAFGNQLVYRQGGGKLQVVSSGTILLRYDGVGWRSVALPLPPANAGYRILSLGFAATGDGWAVGVVEKSKGVKFINMPLILRYHDGVWSVYLG